MIVTDLFESTTGSSEDNNKKQGVAKGQQIDEVFADQGSGSTDRDNAEYMKRRRAAKKKGYTGRETKAGTWRVFKDGNAVAVAGPFKSADEAAAWIKKHKQGVTESSEDNPVANAVTRRILTQRTDLLAKYGPVKVMNAIDDVADFVGDVEEIGSSDVSGWIRQIEQSLSSMDAGLAEGLPQTLRKVVPGYAKREIDKKMDDQKFGRTDVDKDANYYRYKKIQDKIKNKGVAEADDSKFVGFMNKTMSDKVDAPKADTLAGAPAFYRNAAVSTLDARQGFKNALKFGLKALSRLDSETRQQLAAGSEQEVEEYLTDIAERSGQMGDDTFVEEDISEVQDYLSDVFHDPSINSWKDVLQQSRGVAEGWRDLFRSKSATQAAAPTGGSRLLSPTFSANIPNPATNKPYTQAELRALAAQDEVPATTRTGGKKSGEVSMTPNAIRKREARKSVTTAVAPAPNPFGQMVNQLQNYKTSTGGQVRGTATGLKHTANPNNPNAVSTAADTVSNPFGQIANQLQNYKTSTGGQVTGTATGIKNTANPNSTTTMPAAAPVATAAPAVKRSVKPAVRPNFAPQNAGYKSVSYAPNVKTGASMPKPLGVPAPVARSATKVTSGGPTSDEKAKLARRIAQAVKEPVAEMLQMVETKEDVQRIKKFIDDTFVKHGAVNESAFALRNRILEHVTQVGAQRRRDFAAQQTH